MNDETKSRMASMILPCFDFSLLLLVIIFGTAGLSWLTTCPNIHANDPTQAATSPEEIRDRFSAEAAKCERIKEEQDQARAHIAELERKLREARQRESELAALDAKRDALARELAKTTAEIERVEEQLQRLNDEIAQSQSKRDTLQAERDEFARRLAELQARLAELQKKQRSLTKEMKDIMRLRGEVDDIDAELKKAMEEIAKLRERIAELLKPVDDPDVYPIEHLPRYRVDKKREPVLVLINQGTVTPVEEPYYTFSRNGNSITAILTNRGEDAARSLAAGSEFSEFLDGIDPRKQFAVLFVDSQSFETFRTVRAELSRRKIDVGWEPANAEHFSFSPEGRTPRVPM